MGIAASEMDKAARQNLRDRRETIVLDHIAAENRHDVEATVATFQVPRYEVNGEPSDGDAAVRALLGELFTAFPDLCIEPGTIHHADDAVIGEAVMSGTHGGAFAGIAATGRSVRYRAVGIFEFEGDGLMCEKVYFDGAQLLTQLGVLPGPPAASRPHDSSL